MAEMNFNANNIQPQADFSPIPPGDYLVMVVDSALAPTKNNTGQLLKLTHEVIEPEEYRGRKLFDNINVQNQSKQAEEIGQRQLSSICHATGQMNLTDSVQLHNIPFGVGVIIEEQEGFSPRNQVKTYKMSDGSAIKEGAQAAPAQSAPPAQQQQQAPAEAQSGDSKAPPPWKR